jgi:LacI family transcriptional regulator
MPPTIKDVAQAAGVSTATVSHVLNGNYFVSPALRERVLEAVERLGYRPHATARGLRTRRTGFLGLLIPDAGDPLLPALIRGVQDIAATAGYHIVLESADARHRSARATSVLTQPGILDGLILDPACAGPEHLEWLARQGIPLVFIGGRPENWDTDAVAPDEIAGVATAMYHLWALGHRRIGYLGSPRASPAAGLRYEGYRQALAQHGLGWDERLVTEVAPSRYGGYRGAKALLAAPPRPTAFLAASDALAVGALLALREAGLRVPEDISLVSCSDGPIADLTQPPLTTIAQPQYELGARAAQMLVERMEGKETGPGRAIFLRPELVKRQSTAAPPRA